MTHIITTAAARTGLLLTAALLAVGAAPARAAAPTEPAGDWLQVTLTRGDTSSGATRSAVLRCDPPRGHARAAEACAELAAADGDPGRIPLRDTYCPMVYAPVTAQAHGQWRGRAVEYSRTFPNTCVMTARTGAVFALDETREGPRG
ncbi:SSI family serine proteinase inhibitor [Streptomyces sp. JHA26]|uniref:SSI family serine proteinase inhibitor n=1 Tax=Streptomyces sp. JHA26 TaxID=1917143 RepID=UPI00098BC056|nr:SSI family serine proteinase inhibitor [Streptomyces sp. JHA26]